MTRYDITANVLKDTTPTGDCYAVKTGNIVHLHVRLRYSNGIPVESNLLFDLPDEVKPNITSDLTYILITADNGINSQLATLSIKPTGQVRLRNYFSNGIWILGEAVFVLNK